MYPSAVNHCRSAIPASEPPIGDASGSSDGDRDFDLNDRDTVETKVRWHCDGATSDIEAECVFNGVGANAPSATNTSWNIVPA